MTHDSALLISGFRSREPLFHELAKRLKAETKDALRDVRHIDRISFRAKGLESFLKKAQDLDKNYSYPLVEIEDQVAGRVLVFFLDDIDIVVSALKRRFNEIEDKRREPKNAFEFGYESHHLVCMIPPQCEPSGWRTQADLPATFELQIRTLFMHAWAEPQHDLGYKSDMDVPRDIKREWAWAASSAWGADHAFQRVLNWHLQRMKAEPH
jgi:putative GTP pyrophosphokinase